MADTRKRLSDDDTGIWLVTTSSGSVYRFSLDDCTVERVGGEPRATAAPSDSLQPLRGIIELRVGQRGRWWVRNMTGGYIDADQEWQWSSEVVSIEQVYPANDHKDADIEYRPHAEIEPTPDELHELSRKKRSRGKG